MVRGRERGGGGGEIARQRERERDRERERERDRQTDRQTDRQAVRQIEIKNFSCAHIYIEMYYHSGLQSRERILMEKESYRYIN